MTDRDSFIFRDLPDPEAAKRFLGQLAERSPALGVKLEKNAALMSDVLTLVSYSPLLATTLLQNPEYLSWLDRERKGSGVRGKEELLESLARFSLTNSQVEPQVLFARFRRRELLRIYLRDIRRLATIAEITEEISNLADAILESALRLAETEMQNRFGQPLETDKKGRSTPARSAIVALGKLGSRELNYSSDIDLIFIYSADGDTSGAGTRGTVTNREYFVKLAEYVTKLVGQPTGEGAAYRVDLRLRPHGTLGALALSVDDMVRYYETEARAWERQVMIRSRASAGDASLFKAFFGRIESLVFSVNETVDSALDSVRRSKEQIDRERSNTGGYDVKLGAGGIREIEFIAQALQLAHGGRDRWLREGHTLISLDRLADRGYLSDVELTDLAAAYEFLRRTEHVLQMENGVQTHTVPDDAERLDLIARRMNFPTADDFRRALGQHTRAVGRSFARIFSSRPDTEIRDDVDRTDSVENVPASNESTKTDRSIIEKLAVAAPRFAVIVENDERIASSLLPPNTAIDDGRYKSDLFDAVKQSSFGKRLSAMRKTWTRHLLDIVVHDVFETIDHGETKRLQTRLAEASVEVALEIVRLELEKKYGDSVERLSLAVLALGKLGGRGVDYDSDLDLIFVYDDTVAVPSGTSHAEFYGRAVELFVTVLSSMTRDGHLYRVDLRLRPYGSKGLSAMPSTKFLEYMSETAVVWEMLAFVKLRAVGGDVSLAEKVETDTRRVIHDRAAAIDAATLRDETLKMRLALEKQRSRTRRGGDVDIKYGEGGMLDIYFAIRYLQLRDNVPDTGEDRSTKYMLERLRQNRSLFIDQFPTLAEGHAFLSALDHNLRLTVGRTTRVPAGNLPAMFAIARRMKLDSVATLTEHLTSHRLAIRGTFDTVLDVPSDAM